MLESKCQNLEGARACRKRNRIKTNNQELLIRKQNESDATS